MKYNLPDNKLIYESIFDRRGHTNYKRPTDEEIAFKVVHVDWNSILEDSDGEFYIKDVYNLKGENYKSIASQIIHKELDTTYRETVQFLKRNYYVSTDFKILKIEDDEREFYILHPDDFGYNDIAKFIGKDSETEYVQKFKEVHMGSIPREEGVDIHTDEDTLMDLIYMKYI